ncbi:hypothetical protein [Burkholderia sp. B21-005]|uniref:hypothetical protein n=1 Tax=Burkholderia sp. B21-005 TaxID=2890406 RepID=UPI001E467669|nr:hypothetical protein [Burkholderia sp. B21-005]UEP45640.1 hypothetical protein LMA02_23300 [Burkholderia sp. B21-005]
MIKRPEQVRLLAMGLPDTPANRSDSNASSSSTQNNYNDRRNAVQGGAAISGDNNTMFTSITTTDQGAVQAGIGAALAGAGVAGQVATSALNANGAVSTAATSSMADVAKSTLSASNHLADVGLSMLQTSTALADHLTGGFNQATQAVTGIASQLAQTQVAAANDNRYLIAAGMAVVAIVGVMAFSKGKG